MGLPCKTASCFQLGVRFPDGTLQMTAATTTPALPNGTTATTQAAGDNTASLATDAFVNTAINNAIAAVNPAVAVLAATNGSNIVGTYTQVGGGIGDTFTVTATGAFTLDGVAINTIGQRILIKDQTSGQQNGVYFASVVGATLVSPVFTRALDYDVPANVNNTGSIPVQSGTVNALTSWLLTSQVTSIGSSGSVLTYAEFSANPTATQSANTVYAGPTSGAAASPTFRSLVGADLPLPTASTLGGVKSLAASTNKFLTSIGTDGLPVSAQPSAANLSDGTTGSGTVVLSTSPTLSNPIVGTQSSLDNSTKAASTAYVDSATANETGLAAAWFPSQQGGGAIIGANTTNPLVVSPNQVLLQLIFTSATIVIGKMTLEVFTLSSGSHVSFAIYSLAGNRLVDMGPVLTTTTGYKTVSITPVTLKPGWYFLAQTADSTVPKVRQGPTIDSTIVQIANQGSNLYFASAANSSSAGQLPSTLGALSAYNNAFGTSVVKCEPS